MNRAFTVIELLVVVSIIALMTVLILPNYNSGNKQLTLQRAASKLVQDIRDAQELSLSSKEFNGQLPEGGYGFFFWKFEVGGVDYPHKYVLFADLNGNGSRQVGSEDVKWFTLENGVKFSDFYLDGDAAFGSIFTFIAPDPTVCINFCENDLTKIIISIESDPSITKTIILNKAGLVYIE